MLDGIEPQVAIALDQLGQKRREGGHILVVGTQRAGSGGGPQADGLWILGEKLQSGDQRRH